MAIIFYGPTTDFVVVAYHPNCGKTRNDSVKYDPASIYEGWSTFFFMFES